MVVWDRNDVPHVLALYMPALCSVPLEHIRSIYYLTFFLAGFVHISLNKVLKSLGNGLVPNRCQAFGCITAASCLKMALETFLEVFVFINIIIPPPNEVGGGGGGVYWIHLARPSVRPSVCRRHGFRSISQVCFGISISNFICVLMVAIGRSLLIFSDVTFKMAAWRPYWIFWFPDSNFTLALNINFKLQWHNTYVHG